MSDIRAAITHLEPRDVQTRAIEHLVADMQQRLQMLREDNDAGDADTTAKRRGRIAEVKDWLALLEERRQGEVAP